MAAKPPLRKEVAGAMPLTTLVTYSIAAMFASKISSEFRESNTVRLFSITLSFFNLSNKT